MKLKRKTLVICIIVIAFILGCLIIDTLMSSFSAEKWKCFPNARYKMIDSLEKQYIMVGMSEQDIIDLLGNPDDIWEYNYTSGSYELYHYCISSTHLFDVTVYQITICDGVVVGTSQYIT